VRGIYTALFPQYRSVVSQGNGAMSIIYHYALVNGDLMPALTVQIAFRQRPFKEGVDVVNRKKRKHRG
jgi:hypothetical protein